MTAVHPKSFDFQDIIAGDLRPVDQQADQLPAKHLETHAEFPQGGLQQMERQGESLLQGNLIKSRLGAELNLPHATEIDHSASPLKEYAGQSDTSLDAADQQNLQVVENIAKHIADAESDIIDHLKP